MDTLQRFHIEPLPIMLSINSVPAFRPESLPVFVSLTCCRRRTAIKEVTRVHAAAAGPRHHRRHVRTSLTPPPLFWDSFAAVIAALVSGPLQCNRHGPFIDAAAEAPPGRKEHR
jgi:hypothetical protein